MQGVCALLRDGASPCGLFRPGMICCFQTCVGGLLERALSRVRCNKWARDAECFSAS